MSAIARILGINYNTVHIWTYRSSIRANSLLEKRLNKKISFDEMWTYERVRKERNRKSIWI